MAQPEQMIGVFPVSLATQLLQKATHPLYGYPQPLLLLPLLPAMYAARAQRHDNSHDQHHFCQAKTTLLSFHNESVPGTEKGRYAGIKFHRDMPKKICAFAGGYISPGKELEKLKSG